MALFKPKTKERPRTLEELTEEARQAENLISVAHTFRDRIKKTEKSFDKYGKSFKSAAPAMNELAEVSHDFYVDAKVSLEQQFLTMAMNKMSELEKVLADSTKAWGERIDFDVTRFFRIVLDEEIRDLEDRETRLQKARVSYDVITTELEAAKKKDTKRSKVEPLEDKEREARVKFEQVSAQIMDDMSDLDTLVECEVVERLCDYVDNTREHFMMLSRYFNELVPFVYQTRRYVEESRERKMTEHTQFKEELEKLASSPIEARVPEIKKIAQKKFGVPITEAIPSSGPRVPLWLADAVAWLEKYGLGTEGLFRMNANANQLAKLKGQLDADMPVHWEPHWDPHLVAGITKMWFREMPEPILTYSLYDKFIETNNIKEDKIKISTFKELVSQLPQANRDVLFYLIEFLHKLSENAKESKMTPGNLATCFGPNLISPQKMDITTFDPFEPRMVVEYLIGQWAEIRDEAVVKEINDSLHSSSSTSSSPTTSPRGPHSPRGQVSALPLPSPRSRAGTVFVSSSPRETGSTSPRGSESSSPRGGSDSHSSGSATSTTKKLAPVLPARKPRSSSAAPVPSSIRNVKSADSSPNISPSASPRPPPQRPQRPVNIGFATLRVAVVSKPSATENKVDALDLASPNPALSHEESHASPEPSPKPSAVESASEPTTPTPTAQDLPQSSEPATTSNESTSVPVPANEETPAAFVPPPSTSLLVARPASGKRLSIPLPNILRSPSFPPKTQADATTDAEKSAAVSSSSSSETSAAAQATTPTEPSPKANDVPVPVIVTPKVSMESIAEEIEYEEVPPSPQSPRRPPIGQPQIVYPEVPAEPATPAAEQHHD